jgi:hypothetical protein
MFKTLIYGGQEYKNFEIDEFGNVINKKTNHIYKLSKNKNGYAVVYLPAGARGKIKGIRVHKAVAETFIPNPTNLPIVNHIDENRFNPCICNLEWVDYAGNTEAHWRKEKEKGDYFNNRKLTYEEAEQLRKDSKTMGYQKLGKKYGISKVSARNIVIGKCYANGF